MDVRNDTTTGNGGVDKGVELLISADSELEMARGDTLDLEILRSVTSELKNLGGEVLEDGSAVDSSSGSNTTVGLDTLLQESVDTTDRELESGPGRSGDALLSLGTSHCCLMFLWIRGGLWVWLWVFDDLRVGLWLWSENKITAVGFGCADFHTTSQQTILIELSVLAPISFSIGQR